MYQAILFDWGIVTVPRQNTTQCQKARAFILCHLMANNANEGKESQDLKGLW
jgi:hypothetical protein